MKNLKIILLVVILIQFTNYNTVSAQDSKDKAEWISSIDLNANIQEAKFQSEIEESKFFKGFLVAYNKSWSPGDTEIFDIEVPAKFYDQTERLFAYDLFPPTDGFLGWDEYSKELTKIVLNSSKFDVKLKPDTFRYARNGNVAWMSSSIIANGITKGGQEYQTAARQTVILEKTDNKWLVVHEHISVPYTPQQ
ncbi:YybH family protein [Winogradskyella ursingii]|uniref:YybH family protein n=1 Tax=Winogradskyella ursingii TaxID=2686079 RepID=UPI0015CA152E|nr:nuclear transport factor 2 family protein [Winogradskyella ursingii]